MKTVLWICVFLIIWCTVHGQNCPSSCNQGCNTTTLECYCQHCNPQNAECNSVTGVCRYGCEYGYYGNQCMGRCSSAILNCGHCSQNGTVTCTACVTSVYSQYNGGCCSNQCGFDVNGLVPCDTVTGKCSNGCKIGYYGAWCNNSCKEIRVNCGTCTLTDSVPTCTRCASLFSERNVNGTIKCCRDFCQDCDNNKCYVCSAGYYPSDTAPSTCLPCPSHCAGNGICDSRTGKCLFGCMSGYFGDRCTEQCTIHNCRTCNYINGLFSCAECSSGIYYISGSACQLCDERCQFRTCLQTGYCSNGCYQGYYGDMCQNQCLFMGCVTCNRETGMCDRCDPGYYGLSCNNSCPTNCAVGFNATKATCVVATGFCDFGCKDYSYGDQCNLPCTNCYNGQCNRNTGVCTDPNGCKAYWYGEMCDQSCSNCLEGLCNRTSGFCILGCNPGYYSERCLAVCPVNCAGVGGVVRCNFTTGYCLYGCNDGYYGDYCAIGCEHTNCISTKCNIINGYCDACFAGFFGNNCQYKCSSYCAGNGACNQINGTCVDKCKPGITGYMCNVNCTETCINGTCDFLTGRCEACYQTQPSIQCRTADCPDGTYGSNCQLTCSSHCSSIKCTKENGTCAGGCKTGYFGAKCEGVCQCINNGQCNSNTGSCLCLSGYFGDKCEISCSSCELNSCDITGTCIIGCVDGYYGTRCTQICDAICAACSRSDGSCTKCKPGEFGYRCDFKCSSQCRPASTGLVTCSKATGQCDNGCIDGWYGSNCDKICPNCLSGKCDTNTGMCLLEGCNAGWSGSYCSEACSGHCAGEINPVSCNTKTGVCDKGCVTGWYGSKCQSKCSSTCRNNNCIENGYCIDGCVAGFYGDSCQYTCSLRCKDKTCDKNSGNCPSCEAGYYGTMCENGCVQTCLTTGTCEQVGTLSGRCRCANAGDCDCPDGTYGSNCQFTCSLRCTDKTCDKNYGNCLSCEAGYYGTMCEIGCVQTCLTTGTCEQVGTLAGRCRCANVGDCENTSSTLFAILFGVVLGVSVVLVTILSICLHKQRMLATDLKQQLQTRNNTYDGLNMTTPEPYAALTVERSDDSHQSSDYLNPYEGLHRTLESSEPYDVLEIRI